MHQGALILVYYLLHVQERVLIEAYKKCLSALTHCHSGFTDGEQPITLSMCGHSVDTIRYCVSQEKVSIHLPVSRLLAGQFNMVSHSAARPYNSTKF